jgi:hypothetical protein
MLSVGDRVPTASVWIAPHQRRTIEELIVDARALFLFYLFDWSST